MASHIHFFPVFSDPLTQTTIGHLTSLVGGDGHGHSLFRPRALRRYSVHRPDLKGVVGVGLQLVDGHPGSLQAQLLGAEVNAVAAGLTAPAVGPAALTHHVVCQVLASSWAEGRAPLQVYRGLVHIGDEVGGCRRRAYGGELMLLPVVARGQSRSRVALIFIMVVERDTLFLWSHETIQRKKFEQTGDSNFNNKLILSPHT